jgi:hypothetical protein
MSHGRIHSTATYPHPRLCASVVPRPSQSLRPRLLPEQVPQRQPQRPPPPLLLRAA